MQMSEVNSNSKSDATTHMTFVWKIYNLYMSETSYQKAIKSPDFVLHSTSKPKYHFELYPKGKTDEEKDKYISLYLVKSKEKEEKLKKVKYNCSASVSGSASFKLTKLNSAFVISNRLLSADDVTLRFEISYEKDNLTKSDLNCSDEDLDELSSAISKIYDDKLHWDAVLYSRDVPFSIHRALLDVRFPKLAEQVSKNTNNIITISPRIKTAATECLLRYMYSGKLNRQNIPAGIYDAIGIYELLELKSMLLDEPRSIFASTSFKKFSFTHLWIIQNFSKRKSDEICNYFFFPDNIPPWTWFKISFSFSKGSGDGNEDIVFSIERYSSICKTIICRIKVSDLNKTFKHSFNSENMWRIPTFINKNTLLDNKYKYLHNDELSINLDIFVSDGTCDSAIDKIDFVSDLEKGIPQRNMDLIHFQKDLQKLENNPKFSDVTIVTGEDKFHAHKFILRARSPVFHRMFKENKMEEISIPSMDSAVVKSMLKFIYCGEVENNITDIKYAIGLFSAAYKYGISSLQSKCAQLLKTGLSIENAVDILQAADACCDRDLKQHVNDFICSNPFPIMNSEEWENVKGKKDLVLDLLDRVLTLVAENKNK